MKLKLSKYDKEFTLSITLADLFLKDSLEKLNKIMKNKKSQKDVFLNIEKDLEKKAEEVGELAKTLLWGFSQKDILKFTNISDRIIEKILNEIRSEQ
jgi:DNA invertase Pin-like site-specific DNA recombinase